MAQLVADHRDVLFTLFEQLDVEALTKYEKYADFDRKTFEMIIKEARTFGIKEILPTYQEGDREGVKFENGNVIPPECFRRPFKLFVEAEYGAVAEDPELGGQGLPQVIDAAIKEYLSGANFALAGYTMLAHGAGKMIELFGTELQKKMFLKKLYTGEWAGTMLLTEPQAGSDVGALTTTATRNDDGTFSLVGNKIFITGGEHDFTDNIIHPVLARIEGAPAGSKGISLFIVPKFWVNEDGTIGERNGIYCTGVEEKMGLHGNATCSMAMGASGECRGLLLGEENKGMRVMFHMMNEARLGVAHQAFTHASAAYLYALAYARERIQGRALENIADHAAPGVPIIQHPDVRRMLLEMKAYVEGMRSFVYYLAYAFDRAEYAAGEEERTKYMGLVELLTPVAKTYCANLGFDVCVQAVQVYGGAGYTRDYPAEQLVRDCKIASIYEGTDGIQAMDLLGRKLGMKGGQIFVGFIEEIRAVVNRARKSDGLAAMAAKLEEAIDRLQQVTLTLGGNAMSPQFKVAFAHSVPYLRAMGDVVMAWMLLWRAAEAAERKADAKKKDQAFYEGVIKSADYFINAMLPVTMGRMNSIEGFCDAAIEIPEESFGE
jgi:alkylation response protein AidB-like acyl-CoA dehydrogenase